MNQKIFNLISAIILLPILSCNKSHYNKTVDQIFVVDDDPSVYLEVPERMIPIRKYMGELENAYLSELDLSNLTL